MKVKEYVEKKQPILYRVFSNALSAHKLTHSYLLLGEPGIPLKEVAIYLAKSILCEHPSPLADDTCLTCRRISRGEYLDFRFLDGSSSDIKKEDVEELVSAFSATSMERQGIKVYVVHRAENCTPEAVNSLLKFLEEPTPNTYAILTAENESKLLPTIISRCQKIRLKLVNRFEVIEEAQALGVSQDDAEILSYFYNDASLIQEKADEESYHVAKAAIDSFLGSLLEGKEEARFSMENDVIPVLTDKASVRFFFDLLTLFFQDLARKNAGDEVKLAAYDKILDALAGKLPHVGQSLLAIMTLRGEIEWNVNNALLLTHLATILTEEKL